MEAKQAKAIADEVNAPNPQKALKLLLGAVEKAAKRGAYESWICCRAIDFEAARDEIVALGYVCRTQPVHEDGDVMVNLAWA